jgi:hypothetical protein
VSTLLPDFHEDLRWPLSIATHPVLEPRFPIARELAQPGIGWVDLCSRGITNRHVIGANALDMLDYLRAWCAAADHDVDTALGMLASLRGSAVFGLSAAIKLDVPFILCELPAKDAERLLAKHKLDDVDILDNLAATYVELGRDDDALVINRRAIDYAAKPSDASFCHRAARQILLEDRGSALRHIDELRTAKATPAQKKQLDPMCLTLVHALTCSIVGRCVEFSADSRHVPADEDLLWAFVRWPPAEAPWDVWWGLADRLAVTVGERQRALGITALEAALRTSGCRADRLGWVRLRAGRFDSPTTASRVAKIIGLTLDDCVALARE